MINKNALLSLGGYSEGSHVLGCEDWDLWSRAIHEGYVFGKVPERLYIYSLGTSVER